MRYVLLVLVLGTVSHLHADQFVILSLGADQKVITYSLDPDNGSLEKKSSVDTEGKPGAMCASKDGKLLFVGAKGTDSIAAYEISEVGRLHKIDETVVGAGPSFLSIDPTGRFLLSAYYSTGQVAVHGIEDGGKLSDTPLQMFETDERAHCITLDRSGDFAFVPHTRPNAIFQFRFDASTGKLAPNESPKLLRGDSTGPRHLWFHPDNQFAYGSDEQGSSITAYRFDDQSGRLKTIQTLTSLPPEGFEGNRSTSDVEVHPSGRFVYIANRGYDAIVGYSIDSDSGRMTQLGHTPTESVTRSFNISPDGRHLIAAGQKSGKLAVFRVGDDGSLTRIHTVLAGKNPWWVQIVDR